MFKIFEQKFLFFFVFDFVSFCFLIFLLRRSVISQFAQSSLRLIPGQSFECIGRGFESVSDAPSQDGGMLCLLTVLFGLADSWFQSMKGRR